MSEDREIAVAEPEQKIKRPPLYAVILHNDDYTPMDFVVHILMKYFAMGEEEATMTMYDIHTKGGAIAGVYQLDIAETKARMVIHIAQEEGHPLQATIEPVEN